jgi:hypothetical protein
MFIWSRTMPQRNISNVNDSYIPGPARKQLQMAYPGMWRRVGPRRSDVSEECAASIFKIEYASEKQR